MQGAIEKGRILRDCLTFYIRKFIILRLRLMRIGSVETHITIAEQRGSRQNAKDENYMHFGTCNG